MLGDNLADKVTEYHILNEQLMSKALALLDSANNIMGAHDTIEAKNSLKKNHNFQFESFDSTLAYCNNVDFSKFNSDSFVGSVSNTDELTVKYNNEKPEDKIKFTFPVEYGKNECDLLDLETDNVSEVDEEKNRRKDQETIERIVENQCASDNLVQRLLKTKLTIQQNSNKDNKTAEHPKTDKIDDKVQNTCVKVLKNKIETLNDEVHSCQDKLKKKILECEELSKQNMTYQDNKLRLTTQINSLKSQLYKRDEKLSTLNTKIQALETENRSLKSEHDALMKATKDAAQEISGTEVRLTRALKEILTLKEALNNCKQSEKEVKEISRKQSEKLASGIAAAEKREKTLLTAVKKQSILIDNLKKQVVYLMGKMDLDASERHLDRILKWEHK